jgi:hypothetical protein
MSHPMTRRRVPHRLLAVRGPLTRGSDRVEFASRLLAVLVVLLAVPMALVVATVAGTDATQRADQQAATRTQVPAVLLADAAATPDSETGTLSVRTPATWRAPDGSRREGMVATTPVATAGDTVRIWVDGDGERTRPPLDATGVASARIGGGLVTFLLLGALAGGGHLLVCRALWRHRAHQWQQGWAAAEPQWSGRR